MTKYLSGIFLFFVLLPIFSPPSVSAHAGGGPPFLTVNGQFAQTNPYWVGAFPTAQDTAPEKYLVNSEIQFGVDMTKLLVPQEVAEKTRFRWSWEDGSTSYEFGTQVVHTYNKIGSHLVTLDVLAPGDTTYTVIDTVQVNVVPDLKYQLPTVKIAAVGTTYQSGKSIKLVSQATTDPTTKVASYYWAVGGNAGQSTKDISFKFQDPDFLDYVFLKVIDENGFVADNALQASGEKGSITLSSLSPTDTTVPIVGQTSVSWLLVGLGILLLLGSIGGLLVTKRKKKR